MSAFRPVLTWSLRSPVSMIAAFAVLAGCAQAPSPVSAPEPSPWQPVATLQDLMQFEIDPAADALWQSVEIVSTAAGEEIREPRTPEEWAAVRAQALRLAEAANLLLIDGRPVSNTETPPEMPGYLDNRQIAERIAASRGEFDRFAVLLRETATAALRAIEANDAEALVNAGGPIDAACEGCHLAFWYPGQGRPE